ncbi:MAG: DEAD/DEAH box helicase family protein [Opitutales bacterium]|nr:DEAD/DEAH box helicase family protein [Opitutales bacterium]
MESWFFNCFRHRHDPSASSATAEPHPATIMESRNFEFLREEFRELADLAAFAESYAYSDPVSALVKLRTFAEFLVKAVFAHHRLEFGYQNTLNDLLNDASFKAMTPAVIQDKLHLLRIKGNHAAHGTLYKESEAKIPDFLKEAHDLGRWLVLSVSGCPAGSLPTWHPIPRPEIDSTESLHRKTKTALEKIAQQEALMAKLLADLEAARAQAASAKKSEAELADILKQAQQSASVLEFSEEETRLKLIDEHLLGAGWKVGVRGVSTPEVGQEVEVRDQPTASGKGYIDYVLYDPASGKPLAIIEAKKTAEDADKGKMQARYYADGLEKSAGIRPVIFYTNGYEIFMWDDAKGEPPRLLHGFYSLDSLQYLHFQRKEREPVLGALNPVERIVDRLYQIEAIKRVTETFDKRRRKALIIQATGTGKTRVAIALAELMVRAKWAKRILFLCDRRELRKQARDAFEEFLPGEPRIYVSARTSADRNQRIYLATYPAMMKCFQNFDVGFFDLIIADESHRSIYNRYRDLFRWFDAFQVGLTATPVKFIFRNTYRLFECENEDPTFNYPYEEAIAHEPPYLCPFRVIKHTTKFLREGIKYTELSQAQREQLEDQVDDSEAVDYEREHVSRKVFNEDTDRKILQNLMQNGLRNADGTRLGKTIVFARNHTHAKQLVKLFDKMYPQFGGDFCLRIDNYEPRAEQLIDDFKTNDESKNLTIAISVDMLDTGIDIPEIVNLVFAKPVNSYAKFWQMIGRGTRLCRDLFGPGKDKSVFYIFDHWGNFEYFDELEEEAAPSPSKSLTQLLFEARIALGETALKAQSPEALKLATSLLAADVAALPEDCLSVKEKWREIHGLRKDGVIEGFQPATVAVLKREIAPLMQWRDVRGAEAALGFDLLTTRLQSARLLSSPQADDLRDRLIGQVSQLPVNLRQVADKLPQINQAKSAAFHETATTADLEEIRNGLRGIMKYRTRLATVGSQPLFLNVAEDPAEYRTEVHKVKMHGLDLAAYRNRVESVLRELLDQSDALCKIRAGLPVAPEDLDQLASEVLLMDPDLHLGELLVHYPNKAHSSRATLPATVPLSWRNFGKRPSPLSTPKASTASSPTPGRSTTSFPCSPTSTRKPADFILLKRRILLHFIPHGRRNTALA